MDTRAIIIYGPPGSGKGTQSELLIKEFSFIGFDTGRHIETLIYDSKAKTDPVLQRQRKLYEAGELCEPWWVLAMIKNAASKIADSGNNIVLSGSPRTMYEAFDESKKEEGLMPLLARKYDKKNVAVVVLKVKESSSLKRNSARFICSVCGLPVLAEAKEKRCAFCAGSLEKRTDDKPEVIKNRLKEYRERTHPIIEEMKRRGFKVYEINGEPLPYKVFESIKKNLGLS